MRSAHLKLWDYFNHVQATPGFTARIAFTEATRHDAANPWRATPGAIVDDVRALSVSAFFLGGEGWDELATHPDWGDQSPVISLIQHVHHADPENVRYLYLARPAVRICVSDEVKAAIEATGMVRPPVISIPNGIDLELIEPDANEVRPTELLIAAAKRPRLGRKIALRLDELGIASRLLEDRLPREDYLRELRNARVTVFLPLDEEGFYLPALEGFAAGTLVVCPDCIGNRGFCLPDVTSIVPAKYKVGHLADAAVAALSLPPPVANYMKAKARAIATEYGLTRERDAFQAVLGNLDSLWADALASKADIRQPTAAGVPWRREPTTRPPWQRRGRNEPA